MTIFVNTPASLKPSEALQESGNTYKMPAEHKANVERQKWRAIEPTDAQEKPALVEVDEYRSHVTEIVDEFKTANFAVTKGKEDRDAYEFVADLWNMIERMTPWARCVVGPVLRIKTPSGEIAQVPSFVADTYEAQDQSDIPTAEQLIAAGKARNHLEAFDIRSAMSGGGAEYRVTTIGISSALPREAAIKTALGAAWSELETVAIDAYGIEWADEISRSLMEVQALVVAEGYRNEADRRKDAFIAYCMNAMHGAARTPDEQTPLCYRVFADADDGYLGFRLRGHRAAI